MTKSPWRARCSSLGYYSECWYRALLDKANYETGDAEKREPNIYMAFGTYMHWRIQTALGCVVPEPDPTEMAIANAIIEDHDRVANVEHRACKLLKEFSKDYIAEEAWEDEYLTGHTDLRSRGRNAIIDIKVVSKLPSGGRIDSKHYWQLLGYHLLSGAQDLRIAYVSSTGDFASLSDPVDLAAASFDLNALRVRLAALQTNSVQGIFRTPGGHCSSMSCPHLASCRDAIIPRLGIIDRDPITDVGGAVSSALESLGILL